MCFGGFETFGIGRAGAKRERGEREIRRKESRGARETYSRILRPPNPLLFGRSSRLPLVFHPSPSGQYRAFRRFRNDPYCLSGREKGSAWKGKGKQNGFGGGISPLAFRYSWNSTEPHKGYFLRNSLLRNTMGHNEPHRNTTERHGTPIRGNYALKSNFAWPFSAFSFLRLIIPASIRPIPKVSAVSKRSVLVGRVRKGRDDSGKSVKNGFGGAVGRSISLLRSRSYWRPESPNAIFTEWPSADHNWLCMHHTQ